MANKMYPAFFMDMLTQATRIWARKYAQQFVYWNHLLDLFDHLLVCEQDKLDRISFAPNNKPKYLDKAYRMAAGRVLVKCETVKANWKYPEYDRKSTTSEKTKDLIPEVVRLLYEEMKSNHNHGKEKTFVQRSMTYSGCERSTVDTCSREPLTSFSNYVVQYRYYSASNSTTKASTAPHANIF